jgi:hypothetical protein
MFVPIRPAITASSKAVFAILAFVSSGAAQSAPQTSQMKFCGDPRLVGDEPCLPPNWCEGPNGTYPARLDGTCHAEDAENGPPPSQTQAGWPPHLHIPQFRCADGYVPVLIGGGEPACAGDLRPPEND